MSFEYKPNFGLFNKKTENNYLRHREVQSLEVPELEQRGRNACSKHCDNQSYPAGSNAVSNHGLVTNFEKGEAIAVIAPTTKQALDGTSEKVVSCRMTGSFKSKNT
jgi:hypothetical protein